MFYLGYRNAGMPSGFLPGFYQRGMYIQADLFQIHYYAKSFDVSFFTIFYSIVQFSTAINCS